MSVIFCRLKGTLQSRRFQSDEDVKTAMVVVLCREDTLAGAPLSFLLHLAQNIGFHLNNSVLHILPMKFSSPLALSHDLILHVIKGLQIMHVVRFSDEEVGAYSKYCQICRRYCCSINCCTK
jgi:hypothetical protein